MISTGLIEMPAKIDWRNADARKGYLKVLLDVVTAVNRGCQPSDLEQHLIDTWAWSRVESQRYSPPVIRKEGEHGENLPIVPEEWEHDG